MSSGRPFDDGPRAPDPAAVEALYLRHRSAILRATEAVLGRGQDAEDAAHSAFLKAMEGRGEPARGFGAWISRVARNSALDLGRRKCVRRAGEIPYALAAPERFDPASTVERTEWRSALITGLSELPQEIREPLLLHFFADCSLSEIGLVLGLPKSTVQKRYESGLSRLRHRLARFACAVLPTLAALLGAKSASAQSAAGATQTGVLLTMSAKSVVTASFVVLLAVGLGLGFWNWGLREEPQVTTPAGSTIAAPPTPSTMSTELPRETPIAPTPLQAEAFSDSEQIPEARPGTWRILGIVTCDGVPAPGGLAVDALLVPGWHDVVWSEPAPKTAATHSLLTRGGGRFFWDLEPPEEGVTLALRATREGHSTATLETILRRGEPPPKDLRLELQTLDARLVGRVVDPEGQPVMGAQVRSSGISTLSGALGKFELAVRSKRQSGRVSASARGFGAVEVAFQPHKAKDPSEIELKLDRERIVRGHVIGPNGIAVPKPRVQVDYPHFLSTVGGSDGRFEFLGLPRSEQELSLKVAAEGFAVTSHHLSNVVDAVIEVEIQLEHSIAVSGVIVDAQGAPVEGVGVSFDGYLPRALTNRSGGFSFERVRPRDFRLEVESPTIAPAKFSVRVPSPARDISDLRFVVERGGTITGKIVDDRGEPVSRAYVVMAVNYDYLPTRVRANEKGEFRMEGVPHLPGLMVEVFLSGYCRARQRVQPGAADVVVVLKRAAGLAGLVKDADSGEPIRTFQVRLVEPLVEKDENRGSGYWAELADSGLAVSNAEGRWAIDTEELVSGAIFGIEISAPGYAKGTNLRVPAAINPDPAACVISLKKPLGVTVTVLAEKDQAPVVGASVRSLSNEERDLFLTWADLRDSRWLRTEGSGEVRFQELGSGTSWFEVRAKGFPPQLLGPFEIARSGAAFTLWLEPGGTIRGRALNASGEALPDIPIALSADADPKRPQLGETPATRTDREGRFTFTGLLAGRYEVNRTVSRGTTTWFTDGVSVDLPENGTIEVELKPRGSARLELKITPVNDSLADAMISLVPTSSGDRDRRRQVLAELVNGVAIFEGVEPGEWIAYLVTQSAISQEFGRVTLEAGKPHRVEYSR